MDEKDFEGTLILERLGEIGRVEDFFDAIDSSTAPSPACALALRPPFADDVELDAAVVRAALVGVVVSMGGRGRSPAPTGASVDRRA